MTGWLAGYSISVSPWYATASHQKVTTVILLQRWWRWRWWKRRIWNVLPPLPTFTSSSYSYRLYNSQNCYFKQVTPLPCTYEKRLTSTLFHLRLLLEYVVRTLLGFIPVSARCVNWWSSWERNRWCMPNWPNIRHPYNTIEVIIHLVTFVPHVQVAAPLYTRKATNSVPGRLGDWMTGCF